MSRLLDEIRALPPRQLVAQYRAQSRVWRRNGGSSLADPMADDSPASEARVRMWCIWYHLREESTGRRMLADALREEHWSLAMVAAMRQDRASGERVDPVELAREVAALRRHRSVVTAELLRTAT